MVVKEIAMSHSTSQHNNISPSPIGGVLSSASDVALDIIEVGELQVQLARLDAKTASTRSITAFAFVIGGTMINVACLPLVAMALANILSDLLDWELWISQLVVGMLSTCIGVSLIIFGAYRLLYAISAFERSSTEFTHNVSWLKQLVRGLKSSNAPKP
jgi:hypothetical protein